MKDMQRRRLNIDRSHRWLSVPLAFMAIFYTVFSPIEALGASASELMSIPAFVGLLGAVARTNAAMRSAAENPMDDNRREEVRAAVAAMPAAIVAMAMVFQAGKLGNEDYPPVAAMLGGFVDVNAADAYKKFLRSPSKDLIPKTGPGFPADMLNSQTGAAPVSGSSPSVGSSGSAAASGASPDTATAPADGATPASPASPDLKTAGPSSKIVYDDSANGKSDAPISAAAASLSGMGAPPSAPQASAALPAGGASLGTTGPAAGPGDSAANGSKAPDPNPFLRQISNELSGIEASVTPRDAVSPSAVTAEREKDQGGFFKKTSAKDDGEDEEGDPDEAQHGKRHEKDSRRWNPMGSQKKKPDAYQIQAGPKYWKLNPLVVTIERAMMEKAVSERALAQHLSIKGSTTSKVAAHFSLKIHPNYWRMTPLMRLAEQVMLEKNVFFEMDAHAEDDGGGGKDGSKAAEILMGIAAIITAIAPMVIAGIQAKADVDIAKINTKAQIKMTEITADTSKYLAGKQEDIALTQANIAKDISKQNNDFQTKRLDDQLAELRSARTDARQAEQQKQSIEMQYNQERIDLAVKQSNDNLKLARETLNSNLTQAGLTSGFNTTSSEGTRLSETVTTAAGKPEFGTTGSTGGASGSAAGGGGGGLSSAANAGGAKPSNDRLYGNIDKQYQDSLNKLAAGGLGFSGDKNAKGGDSMLGIEKSGGQGGTGGTASAKVKALVGQSAGSAQGGSSGHSTETAATDGPSRLLAGLSEGDLPSTGSAGILIGAAAKTGLSNSVRGIAGLRNQAVQKENAKVTGIGRALQSMLEKNITARGSTALRRVRSRSTTTEPTDLTRFMQRTKSLRAVQGSTRETNGLANFIQRNRATEASSGGSPLGSHSPRTSPSPSPSPFPGAYNVPDHDSPVGAVIDIFSTGARHQTQ